MILKMRIKLLNIYFNFFFLKYAFFVLYCIIFSLYYSEDIAQYSEEKFEVKNICTKSISLKQLIICVKHYLLL